MHPRAGQTALTEDLIDLDALLGAYESVVPDMGDPGQRVVFGTSGHRGTSFKNTFNEGHMVFLPKNPPPFTPHTDQSARQLTPVR